MSGGEREREYVCVCVRERERDLLSRNGLRSMSPSNLARRSSKSRSSASGMECGHCSPTTQCHPLTVLTGTNVSHGLHPCIDHTLLKLNIGIKHLTKVTNCRHSLDGFFIDIPGLSEGVRGRGREGGSEREREGEGGRGREREGEGGEGGRGREGEREGGVFVAV